MDDLKNFCCQNKTCEKYGCRGKGNIRVRAWYGPGKKTRLLHCLVCKKKFSEHRGTVFFDSRLPKEKVVYLLGSGHPVKLTAEVLDLDEQTVRQYFLDYKNRHKKDRNKKQWVQLHYTGKEPSLTNEQEQELAKHLDKNLYIGAGKNFRFIGLGERVKE